MSCVLLFEFEFEWNEYIITSSSKVSKPKVQGPLPHLQCAGPQQGVDVRFPKAALPGTCGNLGNDNHVMVRTTWVQNERGKRNEATYGI